MAMVWKKSSQELVDFMAEKMKTIPCQYRKMFGYPTYFHNGNMFAGLFQDKLFFRLCKKDILAITSEEKDVTPFEPVKGRIMREYVTLPKNVYGDDEKFVKWLKKSIDYVSTLPRKDKRKPQRFGQSTRAVLGPSTSIIGGRERALRG